MQLTKEQVEHIAKLARLELTDDELNKYGEQISAVLGYIDQLQEVDVVGVEPTAQVTGLVNVLRDDVAKPWNEGEIKSALDLAPELDGRSIKVKRVLE